MRDQPSYEPGEHPFDFDDLGREDRVIRHRQKANVPGKKEMILKFAGGSQGVAKESSEVTVPRSSAAAQVFGAFRPPAES